ncbi:MAG: hypothetical protein WAO24_10070 [Peptococcia bacterium]
MVMLKKYELTEQHPDTGLWRIKALRDFGNVAKGDIGGWIEGEKNLSHEGDAWVSGDAEVSGKAEVFGDAWVSGDARVSRAKHTSNVWTMTLGKHTITVDGDYLNIGCESHTIKQWLKNFRKIGEMEGYSPEEIERYGDAITMINKWLKADGS